MAPPHEHSSSAVPLPQRGDRILLFLTIAAVVVRALFLLLEPRCNLVGDEPSWIALGTQELGRPRRGLSPLRNTFVFYPPMYPYFIAVLYRAFGTLEAVKWVQALLGAAVVPAVGRVGSMAFGRRAGLVAAAVVAFYPELVWFSVHFWSETLFAVFLWWAIERLLRSDTQGVTGAAATAGFLWGLATLTREMSLYLAPICLVWLGRRGARAFARAAAFALCLMLTIAPWTIRNALVFHAFIPVSTMGGQSLWQGNAKDLGHLDIFEILRGVDGPLEQDRFARRKAIEAIRARQPLWALEKVRDEMPRFWEAGSEVVDNLRERLACGPLPVTTLVAIEAVTVWPYVVVLAAFVVGASLVRPTEAGRLLLLLLATCNFLHVVAFGGARFRLPLLPVVFVVAAAAVVRTREGRLEPCRGRRAVGLAMLALLTTLVLWPSLTTLALWDWI